MLPDAHANLIWRQPLALINLDVLAQPVFHKREVIEPTLQFHRRVNARQIFVTSPKAEPAAHLH